MDVSMKMFSGLVARATFRRRVVARIRELVRKHGSKGYREKVIRPAGGVPPNNADGHGGPDHFVLDVKTDDGRPVRMSANMKPFYKSDVLASVELDGELVYMKTEGGGVELMADPVSWFQVIDEMEKQL